MALPDTVTIVIPAFNERESIGAVVSGLRAVAAWHEVLVVDDGSTDDSLAVCAPFADDPRFLLVQQQNRGQTAAYAAGVRVATGDQPKNAIGKKSMFLCGLQIIRKNIHNHNPSFTFLFSIIQKQTVFLSNQKMFLPGT